MILLQTSISGTSYQIKTLPKQGFEKKLTRHIDDLKITGPIAEFAKYPLGTVFLADKYDFPEDDHLHVHKDDVFALFFDMSVFPMVGKDKEEVQSICDYTIDYMIDSGRYEVDFIKNLATQFGAYGYEFDWDAKTTPKPMETGSSGSVGGASLKRTIALHYPVPNRDECGFHIDPDIWFLLVRNALRGENTLLVGPTGSGKTEILTHLAKALGKELHIQDMGTVQDAQSALLGVHRINNEGHSAFDYAPFVDHIKSGGIVLLDELNRSPLAANNILFPCLDKRRYLPVDIACDDCDRKIPVNENTVFFATANLGSEYSGTQAIDRALLDRFFPIELDYPQEQDEVQVIMLRTGIEEKSATAIVRVSNEIRKQYKEQELSSAVSVRHTLQAAGLVSDGFEVDKALLSTILPLFEDGIGVSERSKVLSIVSAF
jgi:MoxR-like ATPase